MTDQLDKNLRKLSAKELNLVQSLLIQIKAGDMHGLNIVQLKGYSDIFRVRKGQIRIIFRRQNACITLLTIERRNEKTYRDF